MAKVALFIKSKAKPGQRDALQGLWESHLRDRAAANSALEAYYYCYDNADPDVVHLFEVYRDAAAQTADGGGAAFATFMAEAGPLLDGFPVVHETTPMWIKGG
jgi:quinol monooxygenase YgiN